MENNSSPAKWPKILARFEHSRFSYSLWQLVNSLVPFFALCVLAHWSLSYSYWLSWLAMIPASGFLIRIFIIFHDCCHYSFFKNRKVNEVLGFLTGLLVFCPYEQWKQSHAIHHASHGNLERRGTGDIWTMTLQEYRVNSRWKRVLYHLYRNPIVMFVVGPLFIFLVDYRFNRKGVSRKERIHTYATNAALAVLVGSMCWLLGWERFLLIQLPIFYMGAIAGVWLFYVQHQFEEAYYEHKEQWSFEQAALKGSSFYKLPKVLQWFTGNIGFHHIHHLNPRVPNYLLEEAHAEDARLQQVTTLTLLSSLQSLKFRLWDEETKRFVGFWELARR